jgi:uncharacterized damage-inducible protein DinB
MKLTYSVRQMVVAVALTVGAAVAATQMPVRAEAVQAPTLQAALAADAAQMGEKFAGLARVLDGKYDWRPGPGVRSVGEVLNLIVAENGMLTGALTAAAPAAGRPAAITGAAQMQEALRTSSATLQKTIASLSDADLNTAASIFGQNTTKRGAIMMVLGDQHEHLGQVIAYARMNSFVPPWSK